jgi:hypothetical protein
LVAETYADEDGTIHTGPSGGQFVITSENQMGLVQLVSTEGAPIEDTVYMAFAMCLNKCPHAVLLRQSGKNWNKKTPDSIKNNFQKKSLSQDRRRKKWFCNLHDGTK